MAAYENLERVRSNADTNVNSAPGVDTRPDQTIAKPLILQHCTSSVLARKRRFYWDRSTRSMRRSP
jgi:hypothetical protein